LHERDVLLLKRLQSFFGVGNIYKHMPNKLVYCVQSFNDLLKVIIPHFNKYPLLTQKKSDFLLFELAVNLLNNKAQASIEGLHNIISIRASMNKGLSKVLKLAFPNLVPLTKPVVHSDKIIHPN
jgi:LAGLIDADG endonuclease